MGRFLVFDTKTTCIFLKLDAESSFATPISDFSFIWSFSLPCMATSSGWAWMVWLRLFKLRATSGFTAN